jgi:ethanolamine utilization protein EutN
VKVASVVGTVVSTINLPLLEGRRMLVCDVLGPGGPTGESTIALDVVDAGVGDTVLLLDEGTSARQILGLAAGAIRTVVVGIVDDWHGAE